MRSLLLFIATLLIFSLCIAQNCVYTDGPTGTKLYLDALEHAVLEYTSSGVDTHSYTYTPCRNAAGTCPNSEGSSGTNTAMCRQWMEDADTVCTVVANVDASIEPSFSSHPPQDNGTWEFQFANGDSNDCGGSPRQFNVFLHCDMNAGDYSIDTAGETGFCEYRFVIHSKWACPGQVFVESSSNSISGGTIFCIILISVLFAYFVFGWCLCAVLNRKDRGFNDVVGNIPHITFWTKLPALTFAGCCFTKDFLMGLCTKNSGTAHNQNGNEDTGSNGGNYQNIDQ